MLILAIDSSGPAAAAVLASEERILAEASRPGGRRGAPALGEALDLLWAASGTGAGDLGAVAAALGPGPYTAVRVGLGAAAGLSLALGCPACGVGTHEAIARALPAGEGLRVPVLDAGRGEVWAAGLAGERWELGGELSSPAGLVARLRGRSALLAGPGADRHRGQLEGEARRIRVVSLDETAVARQVARMARERLRAGRPTALEPLYLRPPDARRAGAVS